MLKTNRIAFKEWASIVQALAQGEQILILRKGGVHEKGKTFGVSYTEFFLFPTFEHQNQKDLKPRGQKLLQETLLKYQPSSQPFPRETGRGLGWGVPIRYYCAVENSFWISDEKALRELEAFHIWSWDSIKARFDWGEEKGIFGIIVRVFSLPETVTLENLKRYGGCRSWVELENSLGTGSLKPVLSEPLFQARQEKIAKLLGSLT